MAASSTIAIAGEQPIAGTALASYCREKRWALVLLGAAYLLCFWPTLLGLVGSWRDDPDFSHGFLIPAIAAFLWVKGTGDARQLAVRPSSWGLVPFVGSILLFFAGRLSHTNAVERLAAWGALAGAAWALLGATVLRAKAFPLCFLLLAIPPPQLLLGPLRLGLKTLATRIAADVLAATGHVAVPEGNVLVLEGHRFEVADACSGVRSLMAIVATAVLLAFVFRSGWWKGAVLTLIAVPVTVLINVVRIVFVAWALVVPGLDVTSGLPHEALGAAVFVLGLGLLLATRRFLDWLCRWRPEERAEC